MDLKLKDKVALVTGVGSQIGFGKGIAATLAAEGCYVVGADIDLYGAEKTAAEIHASGYKAMALKVDVSDIEQVEAMVKTTIAKFSKIDILINNAGTSTVLKPFLETTKEEFDKIVKVNLWGTMNVTRAVIPYMIARKYGRIVNITGGQGVATISLYGASKAGVDSFTRSMAQELLEHGIIVNGVHPGLGNTGLNIAGRNGRTLTEVEKKSVEQTFGLKRFCTGEDMGPMVAFLASDTCSYMVGQVLFMSSGGRFAKFP
jgi:NAD(P)-dependent dehydrogenase (short-subunit alcohol dehydrogenase family)